MKIKNEPDTEDVQDMINQIANSTSHLPEESGGGKPMSIKKTPVKK